MRALRLQCSIAHGALGAHGCSVMPRLIHQRRLQPPTTCAKRNDKYPRDDSDDLYDVKLDGEDDWPQARPADIVSSAWSTVKGLAEGLADVIYQFVPSSVSRTVVNTGTKAGLLLLALSLLQSMLSLVITVGVVTLVGYVATRVWGRDGSSFPPPPPDVPRRRGRDADVVDVWFEERKEKK